MTDVQVAVGLGRESGLDEGVAILFGFRSSITASRMKFEE